MSTQTLPETEVSEVAPPAPQPVAEATPEEEPYWRVKLTRNPVVKLVDKLDEPPARKWKDHKALADEIAETMSTGSLFTLVQHGGKGVWCSEWTVVGKKDKRYADRRRAGQGKTVHDAVMAMCEHPSFHKSHVWAPEETAWSMLKRLF